MIPLLVQVGKNIGTNSPWRVYVNAGPSVSFLMSGYQKAEGFSKLYDQDNVLLWNKLQPDLQNSVDSKLPGLANMLKNGTEIGKIDITGEFKSVNIWLTGNFGLSYNYKGSKFFVEAGGNYGFINVQKSKINGTNTLASTNIMVGYALNIKNF